MEEKLTIQEKFELIYRAMKDKITMVRVYVEQEMPEYVDMELDALELYLDSTLSNTLELIPDDGKEI